MKRISLLLAVLLLLGLVVAAPVLSADTATIDLSVQNALLSITVDTPSFDWGPQPLGGIIGTPPIVVSNVGNVKVDLVVHGTDATMPGTGNTWALLDTATAPGLDQFRLDAVPTGGGAGVQVTHTDGPLTSVPLVMVPGSAYPFSLVLTMPESVTQRGTYNSQVVITATEITG